MDTATYPSAAVIAFLSRWTIPVRVSMEKRMDVGRQFHIDNVPRALVIDPDGKLLGQVDGYASPDKLLAKLRPLCGPAYELGRAEAALAKAEGDVRAHFRAAGALAELGKKDDAAGHWRRIVELDPKDESGLVPDSRFSLGNLAAGANDFSAAESLLAAAVAADPDQKRTWAGEARFRLAAAREKLGKADAALAGYREVAEKFPKSVWGARAGAAIKRLTEPEPGKDGPGK